MRRRILAGLCALGLIGWVGESGAQTGDARRIEGQTGIDPGDHFSITLPSDWQFEAIDPSGVPCFSFAHRGDPSQWGQIRTQDRLQNETARGKLEGEIAESQYFGEEISYEAGPIMTIWLGGEEAFSCVETSREAGVLRKGMNIVAAKGQHMYYLSISAPADRFDALQADIEFIRENLQFE